jgi:hypothetical protein
MEAEVSRAEEVAEGDRQRGTGEQGDPQHGMDVGARSQEAQVAVLGEIVHAPQRLALGCQLAEVADGERPVEPPQVLVRGPGAGALAAAAQGVPLVVDDRLGIGAQPGNQRCRERFGILTGIATELEEGRRFQLHRGPDVVVVLPDRDDDESEQHGVDRAHDLELGSRHVVVRGQGLPRQDASGDEQAAPRPPRRQSRPRRRTGLAAAGRAGTTA